MIPSLQEVPIGIGDGQIVYLDMQDAMCRDVLRNSPYVSHPWEPDEQAVIRRLVRPGDVVFDIGAHFGEHSALMADLVGPAGRIIAFEPNPDRQRGLRRTMAERGNGELLGIALADACGTARLFVPEFHVTASLADWTARRVGPVRELTCEQDTIDRLLSGGRVPRPQFIKCDVEGAELLVFKGAAGLLDRADAPIVMYEANGPAARAFGTAVSASTEYLRGLSAPAFSFFWVQPGGALVPIDAALQPGVDLFNLVAIPAHRRAAGQLAGCATDG